MQFEIAPFYGYRQISNYFLHKDTPAEQNNKDKIYIQRDKK